MTVKKIYIDMDGVLADFDRGLKEFCGLEPIRQKNFGPGAKEMFDTLYEKYGDKVEILSAIPKDRIFRRKKG